MQKKYFKNIIRIKMKYNIPQHVFLVSKYYKVKICPRLSMPGILDKRTAIKDKFHLWHKLENKDYEKRVKFALWFLEKPAPVLDHMIFRDEAYFYLTLPVNKHNNRIYGLNQLF